MAAEPITRRGALGRILGLGAGAAAAVVLPATVQAAPLAPIAPALPDWLTDCPEWLVPMLEQLALRAPNIHESQLRHVQFALQMAVDGMDGYWTEAQEMQDARRKERIAALEKKWAEPIRAEMIDDGRVAVIRFGKLDRNARRRAQRWIARQPRGGEHPVIRLRLGRNGWAAHDFLDVAQPKARYWDGSPYGWAVTVFQEMKAAIWIDHTNLPPIGAYTLLCSHYRADSPGAQTTMAAYPDGRLATYVYEAMA